MHVDKDDAALIKALATACLIPGLKANSNKLVLLPVLMSQVGDGFLAATGTSFAGKLQKALELQYDQFSRLIWGPGEVAVLPKLQHLLSQQHYKLFSHIKVIYKHPKA